MWRSKKFIIIAVLTILVIGATLGGVAIAQADDQNTNPTPTANVTSFLDKVAEIYQKNTGVTINPQELQKAITEARQAIKDEALNNYLQKLVTAGKITQEQADQFKAWLDAKPTQAFQQWWDARPDIPGLFGNNGTGMPFGGIKRGMGRFGMGMKSGAWSAPNADTQ
jgi:hypothetical protein